MTIAPVSMTVPSPPGWSSLRAIRRACFVGVGRCRRAIDITMLAEIGPKLSVVFRSPLTRLSRGAAMPFRRVARLAACVEQADLISTDVFDTLLLRTRRSERSRIIAGERLFARTLAERGSDISADLLVDARLHAQRMAFRALGVGNAGGEVRLVDIVGRQLRILGLPPSLVCERLAAELTIERASLVPNGPLVGLLRARRRAGARIIAVSDTTLPAHVVDELIRHFCGPDLIDRVYASADLGKTKRDGDLFLAVAEHEGVPPDRLVHLGDDALADLRMPLRSGLTAHHTPRPVHHRYRRSVDGACTEAARILRRRRRAAQAITPRPQDAASFGHDVFGPIVTQFCLCIWLYAAQAETTHRPVLLFCARGGIGIRDAFERVLARLELPLDAPRANLMVSRLIAARAALLAGSGSAAQELDREFRGGVLADVAEALGGRAYDLPEAWSQPFRADTFLALLAGPSGRDVVADIRSQNALFIRHLDSLVGDADRVILCDTGLYGSTQRLLASAFPAIAFETIQFARSNYKGHAEEHFAKVTGVFVQDNRYDPLNMASCVLRFWHLIESLFEPAIPSARLFAEDERGTIACNCGEIAWGLLDPAAHNRLLAGALAYVDGVSVRGDGRALDDADVAWDRLRGAITRPSDADLRSLDIGVRSVDFGRPGVRQVFTRQPDAGSIRGLLSLKGQLWREGAIARQFPHLRRVLWPLLDALLALKGLRARLRR